MRLLQKPAKKLDPKVEEEVFRQELGSFLAANAKHDDFLAEYGMSLGDDPRMADLMAKRGASVPFLDPFASAGSFSEVPISIGKPR